MKMNEIVTEDFDPFNISIATMPADLVLQQARHYCNQDPNGKQCAMFKERWKEFSPNEKEEAKRIVKQDKADRDFKADITNTMIKARGDSNSKSSRSDYKWTNPGAF